MNTHTRKKYMCRQKIKENLMGNRPSYNEYSQPDRTTHVCESKNPLILFLLIENQDRKRIRKPQDTHSLEIRLFQKIMAPGKF